MKKQVLFFCSGAVFALSSLVAQAQISTPTGAVSTNQTGSTGNIGINTTQPAADLHIVGKTTTSNEVVLQTTAISPSASESKLSFRSGTSGGNNGNGAQISAVKNAANGYMSLYFRTIDQNWALQDRLVINALGSVGIGTSTVPTGYLLGVNGKIIANSIKVQAYAYWSDYVFNKDYKLKPLEEVEAYIAKENHLPDVPSAAEVVKDGIDPAQMLEIQMRKIEELTLYVIELQKEVNALKK